MSPIIAVICFAAGVIIGAFGMVMGVLLVAAASAEIDTQE